MYNMKTIFDNLPQPSYGKIFLPWKPSSNFKLKHVSLI